MEFGEEIDQFELLEKKIDALISLVTSLSRERDSMAEKVQILEGKTADLTNEVESLKTAKDSARQRIVSLLEKIEQLNI